ncbi:MAG: hypothetical protein OJF58_003886 [Enhydrobacter sp.]|nr:MAG: hypothetical protein OJF58_003886 [Enhydrobacter sp.]
MLFVAAPVERNDAMTYSQHSEERPTIAADIADQVAAYGITRVPVDYFHVGEFRYSNPEDAIAEARRQRPTEVERTSIGRPQ